MGGLRFMVSQRLSYRLQPEPLAVDGRDVDKLQMVAKARFGLAVATEETWSCCFQSKAESGVNFPMNLTVDLPY